LQIAAAWITLPAMKPALCSLVLLLACDRTEPYDAKPEPAAEKPVAAAPEQTKDEEGCIYAEGEKDQGEQAECPHGANEAAPAGGNEGHFGAPFTLADAQPLGTAVEGKPDGTVLVRGEVEAVCQKKGCWMVIKDGVQSARVLMKDHGFAVPMDSRGKKARVEGTLTSRTFTEAQVKHLEQDAGKDPAKVAGQRTEHVLTATGIEITS
jgi:hypothetical protein